MSDFYEPKVGQEEKTNIVEKRVFFDYHVVNRLLERKAIELAGYEGEVDVEIRMEYGDVGQEKKVKAWVTVTKDLQVCDDD